MLVIGDSHVRRLEEFRGRADRSLRQVSLEFVYRGGAHIRFAEERRHLASRRDVVVLCIGGNDLSDSRVTPTQVADRLYALAERLIDHCEVQCVVVMALWPRSSGPYNRRVAEVNGDLERRMRLHPAMALWQWNTRLRLRNYDGVHLERQNYDRAVRSLVAAIVWAINHMLW